MISKLHSPLKPAKRKTRSSLCSTKPSTSLSGVKRKAYTPPVEVASQPLSLDVPKKNMKQNWSCPLCEVSATSEHGLNDHLQGKKRSSRKLLCVHGGTGVTTVLVFSKRNLKLNCCLIANTEERE